MKNINFGRTGVKVSRLCLGCMNFGGRTSEEEAMQIIHRAVDAGVNFIDTANVYGHEPGNFSHGRGRSEEIVGRALQGRRDRVFLATKVHYPMSEEINARGNSRRHILEQCAASLKRLQTDYIDLYQLHSFDPDVPIDETLRALDDLVRRGWVRYIGSSGFPAWRIIESLWAAKELGLNRFVSEQAPYNLLDRRIERQLFPMAQSYGIGIMTWSPLAGGFLTGKYRLAEPPPANSRFETFWHGFGREHDTAAAQAIIEQLEEIAREKEITPAELALAWQLHQPGLIPIIGPRTLDQLNSALRAVEIELSDDELAQIDEISPPGSMTVPYYGGSKSLWWDGWRSSTHHWV